MSAVDLRLPGSFRLLHPYLRWSIHNDMRAGPLARLRRQPKTNLITDDVLDPLC